MGFISQIVSFLSVGVVNNDHALYESLSQEECSAEKSG